VQRSQFSLSDFRHLSIVRKLVIASINCVRIVIRSLLASGSWRLVAVIMVTMMMGIV
jgi:hypothetical protein